MQQMGCAGERKRSCFEANGGWNWLTGSEVGGGTAAGHGGGREGGGGGGDVEIRGIKDIGVNGVVVLDAKKVMEHWLH